MINKLHQLAQQKDIKGICDLILSSRTIAQWNKTIDEYRIIYGYNIENYWKKNLSFEENEKIAWAINELKSPVPQIRSFKK